MMVESPTKAGRLGAVEGRASGRAGRSASSGSRATGATRTSASTARSRRRAFDEIIVREDKNLRGRAPGETAANVLEGVRGGQGRRAPRGRPGRTRSSRRWPRSAPALRRAIPGDLVVCCVDDAIGGLPRGDGRGRHVSRRDGVRRPGRARPPRKADERARAARTCGAGRGSCGCAGSTCCSPIGRSMPTRCGRSSRDGLELDLFDGPCLARASCRSSWRTSVRAGCPAPPAAGRFPELNVRTYVRHEGRPGVWFLSLDAASRPAVEGARTGFGLPYFHATMSAGHVREVVDYRSRPRRPRGEPARFEAATGRPDPWSAAPPGSLEAWLTDRMRLSRRTGRAGSPGPRSCTAPGRSSPRPRGSSATRWPRRTDSRSRTSRRTCCSRRGSMSAPGGRRSTAAA